MEDYHVMCRGLAEQVRCDQMAQSEEDGAHSAIVGKVVRYLHICKEEGTCVLDRMVVRN